MTEVVFELRPPGGLFDDTVIRNAFPGQSTGARRALLHRAVRAGEVLRLKPGLYCLKPSLHHGHAHPFVVAAMLCYPSQVSIETALSFHGLIPEGVHQVTSVVTQRSRVFETPLGRFVFRRVPCNSLRAGAAVVRIDGDAWVFVATPLRAIADLVYTRRAVTWERDGIRFLTDSMRVDRDELEAISFASFEEIHDSLRSLRTRRYLAGLRQELGR